MTRDEAIDRLAARLFWNMERYEARTYPIPGWEDVPKDTKGLYRALIRDIVEFDVWIKAARS